MMDSVSLSHPAKTTFKLLLKKQAVVITISSNFDSGNMSLAQLGLNNCIIITPANDCSTSDTPSHSKGWFHFTVEGVPVHTRLKFVVKKMQQLTAQIKFSEYFKPVFKCGEDGWERVDQAMTKQDDTQLHFEVPFFKNVIHSFAYSFPFSFQECENAVKNAHRQAKLMKGVYFKDEVMIRTPEGRPVRLLTISSSEEKEERREDKIDSSMFNWGDRAIDFKPNKKIVIISARVHPGEAPSSHTFNGVLKFILSSDARAHFLRKHFVFKLIPMLNPDGVYHGHYRMDTFGQNLNRFYLSPDVERQPAVYAVRRLGEYYKKQERLGLYVDLHAHPQRKGNFIYGNAMDSTEQQVQTQLFPRILALNCPEFDYPNSSFSKYHMNARDKNEDLTKEGCGRVVFNTQFQLAYAYTMECGYTASTHINEICSIENAHRKFEKFPIIFDDLENLKSPYYSNKKTLYFTIKSYQNLGKNILVSILDLFQLNPASRIPHTSMKSLAGVKEEIGSQLAKGMAFSKDKLTRSPITVTTKQIRVGNVQRGRGCIRAPSIQSSKEVGLNKLRNRTIAKINIGQF